MPTTAVLPKQLVAVAKLMVIGVFNVGEAQDGVRDETVGRFRNLFFKSLELEAFLPRGNDSSGLTAIYRISSSDKHLLL